MSALTEAQTAAMRWQDQVYDLLRQHNITQFAYVPDAGHRILIDRSLADADVHSVALTTEEEGVALLAGADLGGAPPAIVNAVLDALAEYGVLHLDMPITPQKVWWAINESRGAG